MNDPKTGMNDSKSGGGAGGGGRVGVGGGDQALSSSAPGPGPGPGPDPAAWDAVEVGNVIQLKGEEKELAGMVMGELDFSISDLKEAGFTGPNALRIASWIKRNKPAESPAKWQKTDIRCDVCGSDGFKTTDQLAAHGTKHTPIDLGKLEWPGDDEKGPHLIKVNGLQYAGLSADNQGTKTLYIRDEVSEMWCFLGEPARTSMVQGPPGTGKSSSTWVWARNEAASGKSVLWVHLCQGYPAVVAQLEGTTVVPIGEMEITTVEKLVRSSTANIIVLDGVVSETRAALLEVVGAWVSRHDGRRVVRVTSESITVTAEALAMTRTKEHTVPSWTLEQYKTALTSVAFKGEVEANLGHGDTLDEKLANKFFLAGGCARWMFGFSYAGALGDIDKQLAKSKDKQALSAGLQGHKAQGAVNHLIQRPRCGKIFLVSDYVARCLSEDCELAFVKQALQQAQGNPGFDGIVLELDFMAQLRVKLGQALILNIGDCKEEEWKVWKLTRFTQPEELKGNELQGGGAYHNKFEVTNNSWLVPKLFNQGGYDAVQVLVPDAGQDLHIHVRFVQVTRSNTHTLKLKYMLELLSALVAIGFKVDGVLVDFVVPAGHCGDFKLGSTSGSLDNFGWRQPAPNEFGRYIRVAGFERTK